RRCSRAYPIRVAGRRLPVRARERCGRSSGRATASIVRSQSRPGPDDGVRQRRSPCGWHRAWLEETSAARARQIPDVESNACFSPYQLPEAATPPDAPPPPEKLLPPPLLPLTPSNPCVTPENTNSPMVEGQLLKSKN